MRPQAVGVPLNAGGLVDAPQPTFAVDPDRTNKIRSCRSCRLPKLRRTAAHLRSSDYHRQRANAARSKVRCHVEHPFAELKDRMGLFVRTIGITRAKAKIGMANIVFNMKRMVFWERKLAAA